MTPPLMAMGNGLFAIARRLHTLALSPAIRRLASGIAVAAMLVLLGVSLHLFAEITDRAPKVGVDDALTNVASVLAKTGIYGFPASPSQPTAGTLRDEVFYNYGPAYFYIGAGLQWLFGTSLVLMRAIHPMGLAVCAILAAVSVRRWSLPAALIAPMILFFQYWNVHWTIARPDIMVSVFASVALWSVTAGFMSGNRWLWGLAGLGAATAATTHLIAWAIIPWLIVLWCGYAYLDHHDNQAAASARIRKSFFAAFAGGLGGVFLYLAATHFRIDLILTHVLGYKASVGQGRSYWNMLAYQASQYWAITPGPVIRVATVMCAILAGLWLYLPWASPLARRRTIALTVPPTSLAIGYLLSLGSYPNWHAGYNILFDVCLAWTAAGTLASLLSLITEFRPASARLLALCATMVLSLIALVMAAGVLRTPPYWVNIAKNNAPFGRFADHVLESIPSRARVWASVTFALETGFGRDIIQFGEGAIFAGMANRDAREDLAPDALIIADEYLSAFTSQAIDGSKSDLDILNEWTRHRYVPTAIVQARPYGQALVFRNSSTDGELPSNPRVDMNDGASSQWFGDIGPVLDVRFEPSKQALTAKLRRSGPFLATTTLRLASPLPPGHYLLRVDVATKNKDSAGVVLAADQFDLQLDNVDGSGFPVPQGPYFNGVTYAYLLIEHKGGPLVIAQFDHDRSAKIRSVAVQKVHQWQVPDRFVSSELLAPLDGWHKNEARSATASGPGGLQIEGDDSRFNYQLTSPSVSVAAGTQLQLDVSIQTERGPVAVGVTDGRRWIVPPTRDKGKILFTATDKPIRVIIANDQESPGQTTRFTIEAASLKAIEKPGTYIHELTSCRRARDNASPPPIRCRK